MRREAILGLACVPTQSVRRGVSVPATSEKAVCCSCLRTYLPDGPQSALRVPQVAPPTARAAALRPTAPMGLEDEARWI